MLIRGDNYPDCKFTYGKGICDECWKKTAWIPVHIPMSQKAKYIVVQHRKKHHRVKK